jgi:alpha-glucosidase
MAASLPWWQHAVVYQLYVRSFADANGDGIGDLEGIRQRLDYLADLGVDAIWLNPCYPSPQVDHGYDVADYFDIDPDYGDLATFDRLLADARRRGIKILMDVVPNHCSSQHEWFQAALLAGPGSPQRERFYFRDGRGPNGDQPPNNWRSIFSGSAWNRVTEPDGSVGQWYLAVFAPEQPDLNWDHPDVPDHFDRMLRFWFDRGVEGFRADAVTVLGKAPGLPDYESPQTIDMSATGEANPLFNMRPEGHVAWQRWRRNIDTYQAEHPQRDLVLVAEAFAAGRPEVQRAYVNDREFHQAFAFDLTFSAWSAPAYRHAIELTLGTHLPDGLAPAWTLNNHDTQRSVTRFGRADATTHGASAETNLAASHAAVDLEIGLRRARAAVLLELGLPGGVYLYAGEELGLPEVLDLPAEARQDPVFLRTEGRELGRDGCRVPLPWQTEPASSHGFSLATDAEAAWMPQPTGWGAWSVESQQAAADSMLSLYRHALRVRRATSDLRSLDFAWLSAFDDEDLVAFSRGDTVVIVNCGDQAREVPAPWVGARQICASSIVGPVNTSSIEANSALWLR